MWNRPYTRLRAERYLASRILLSSRSLNGRVAEWLGTALQKLLLRFESARDLNE